MQTNLLFAFLPVTVCSGLTITEVANGVVHHEDGVIISTYAYETHVLTISFPKFTQLFERLLDKTNVSSEMKKLTRTDLIKLGNKLDDNLETSLSLWYQEVNMQGMFASDLKPFWMSSLNESKNRKKRAAPLVLAGVGLAVVAGMGAIMSGVNTYQIKQINDVLDRQTKAISSLDATLQDPVEALKKTSGVANVNAENIVVLFKALNEVEFRIGSLYYTMLLLHEISISSSMQMSEINFELDHLREGRFPYKLLSPDVLDKFLKVTSREDGLIYPLRLIESRVLGVDVNSHEVRFLVNVPVMKEVAYYMRVKVVNIGYQDSECRSYLRTPKFLASIAGKLIPVNEKYCTTATPAAFKCEELAILSAAGCWPPTPNCGVSTRCPVPARVRIVTSGKGYLVTFKNEIIIKRNGKIIKSLNDSAANFFVHVKPGETISVDGFEVQSIQHGIVNSYEEWNIMEENVTSWSSNFSDQINNMQSKQQEMNSAIKKIRPIDYPFLPGLDHVDGLQVAFWVGIITPVLLTLLFVGFCIWHNRRGKALYDIANGIPLFQSTAPIAPAPPSQSRFRNFWTKRFGRTRQPVENLQMAENHTLSSIPRFNY